MTAEKRLKSLALSYYSRKDIQKAIFEFCRNRETIPRHLDSFGKRPDTLEYPSDILQQVKRGATSFHCSEELWTNPLELSTDLKEEQLNDLRIGWDLCLPDFEGLFVKERSMVKKMAIKQLAKELGLNTPGRFRVSKNLEVLSINPNSYKIEYDTIKDIIIRKQKKKEKIFKITTDDGKEIFVSKEHPLPIFTNEGIKQKTAKEVSNNDYLLIPLKLNLPQSCKYIDIIDLIKKTSHDYKIKYKNTDISWILIEGKNYYYNIPGTVKNYIAKGVTPLNFYLIYEKNKSNRTKIKLRLRRSKLRVPPLIKLDYHFGKLIGYYLSEGSTDKHRLEFVFNQNEIKEAKEVISLFNKIFKTNHFNKKTIEFKKNSKALRVRINSKLLSFLFSEVLGLKRGAYKKEIPCWVYNTTKDFVSGILTGYFIGDGSCIYEHNEKSIRIDAVSASKSLIEGLSLLCIKLGINCNIIKSQKFNTIRISGEEGIEIFTHFCKEFVDKKNIRFIPKSINHPSKHSMYPPFLDTNLIKKVENRNKKINLYRAIRLGMRLNKKMILLAADKPLKKIIKNNLFPIKIKEIESIEYRGLFYDIETEKNHNFLQGDGVFTYNCLDIDSKYLDYSKTATKLIIEVLKFHGIKNFGVKFSGSKGMHIIIPWKAFPEKIHEQYTKDMFPEWARIIVEYIKELINKNLVENISEITLKNRKSYVKDKEEAKKVIPDLVLVSPRHLFRAPYSLHEKGLVSVVIDENEIENFQPKFADPLRVIVKDFYPKAEENEARELLISALDWYKEKKPEKKNEKEYQEIKIDKSKIIFPPCISKIMKGLPDGRKRALFILINYFKSLGLDLEEMESKIKEWNKKNKPPLKEGYIISQLNWHKRQKSILPPNCDKDYYKGIGVCSEEEKDELCEKIKNPVNYSVRKQFRNSKERGKQKWQKK